MLVVRKRGTTAFVQPGGKSDMPHGAGRIELAPLAEQTVLASTKGKARVPSGNVEKLFVETAVPTGPIDQVHFEDPVTYVAGAVFSPHWMC